MKQSSICIFLLCFFMQVHKCKAQVNADFTASLTSGCSPIVVNFSDQSQGNPSEWRWDLGNGTYSTLKNPSVTYFAPGFYTIKLWVRSGSSTDSVTRVNYIHVLNSPVVDFSASVTTGCSPLAVHFTDNTSFDSFSIAARQWDFGDGILSGEQNPLHLYSAPGNFNVTLKVTAVNGCTGTARKSSYINNQAVKAAFTNWGFGVCYPNKIAFQNASEGEGLQYNWQFGDGTMSPEANPVHIYGNAGTYIVKLFVHNGTGCVDSASKNVVVTMPLKAAFAVGQVLYCKTPANAQFTNLTAGNNNNYTWSFGDSTFSAAVNPVHQYNMAGIYSVKLVARNSLGCSDSVVMNNLVKVRSVHIQLPSLPDSGCTPFTKHFTAVNTSPDSIVDYSWNFGNEIQLSGRSPSYTFAVTGNYNLSLITLTSEGCRDTISMSGAIRTGEKPQADFSADIFNTCASRAINFYDLSTGDITSWQWDFGDQRFSNEPDPSHIYQDTGWMTVQLTVRNMGCADTVVKHSYVYLKPAVAKFKAIMDCSEPYKRVFDNLSLGAERWQWDFGDGTTSTAFSPVHIFPQRGAYHVVLRVWNDLTGCAYSSAKTIKIIDIAPGFFAQDTVKCKQDSIFFHAVPDPGIVNYTWDFGDGVSVTTEQPMARHQYNSTGNYNVRLTVRDSFGCARSVIKNNYIKIAGPVARFGSSSYDVCINNPVTFTDSSVATAGNNLKRWEWDYGDGNYDTLYAAPFVHTYVNAGNYWPFLKLTDIMGCTDTFRLANPVRAGKLNSFFFISDSAACPGYSLKFVCPFSAPGITYLWDFGDGTTSSRQIPYHSYDAEGSYTVKLFVSKLNSCTDSTIIFNAIKVKRTVADFSLSDSFSTCPPLLVHFTGNSVNTTGEWWGFGDSTFVNTTAPAHYYTYPGEYKVMLVAKGPGTCADTMQKKIIIKGPTGSFYADHLSSCRPYAYNFVVHTSDAASYVWDFNDGVTMNGVDTVIHHVYADSGKFTPKIILQDINGCRVPVVSKDTLVNVFIHPGFVFSDSIVCSNANVAFSNLTQSNDIISSYTWQFGDSTSSLQADPIHRYNSPGTYYPSLQVVTAGGCSALFQSPAALKALSSPHIQMQTTGNGCAPLQVTCTAATAGADASTLRWKWDMGNGDTSLLQNPPAQVYNSPGSYIIQLSVSGQGGCNSISRDTIQVYKTPATVIRGDSAICRGQQANLYAGGADSYHWYPTTGITCDTCAVVTVRPLNGTQYILNGNNTNGCSSNDTMYVNVHQPVRLQYTPSVNICRGNGIFLTVSGSEGYRWTPSYGLSDTVSGKPFAEPGVTTEYAVIGSDAYGCFSDTAKIVVRVNELPWVKACDDKTIAAGTPVSLEAAYSNDVVESRWFPTDGSSRYDFNSILVKPTENTEYTVKVKNSAGCQAMDKVNVFVTCNKNNVFVPTLFSPNNDGVNDVFYPRGTGVLTIQALRIFNRWGQTVFEKRSFNANDPSAGWDGTYKGTKLTSDVFVYVMELVCENKSVLSFQGNISLVQ